MNLLSEKVHFSGLRSLWPEITRILNIPHYASCLISIRVALSIVFSLLSINSWIDKISSPPYTRAYSLSPSR
jgi:hypothetical protein